LPVFDQASRYDLISEFNFLQINCGNKDICDHFKVNKYPTIKIFIEGESNEEEPNRDLESILEYLTKLTSDPLIQINSKKDLENFRTNYGDMNFLVVLNKGENNEYEKSPFYKCIYDLANGQFKSMFYFGIIDKKNYDYKQFENKLKQENIENFPNIVSVSNISYLIKLI